MVCLHCGYRVPDDRLRTCPQCGQLLPVEEAAVGRSQYISGDLLKQRPGAQERHPYLWGVESAKHEAVQLGRGGGFGGTLLVAVLLVVLVAGALGALYATGNAPWMPILPHHAAPAATHPAR